MNAQSRRNCFQTYFFILGLATSAYAQIIVNGDFESPVISDGTLQATRPSSWTGGFVLMNPNPSGAISGNPFAWPQPNTGQQFADIGNTPPSALSQTFTIASFATYSFTWFDNTARNIAVGFQAAPYSITVFNSSQQIVFSNTFDSWRVSGAWQPRSVSQVLIPGSYRVVFTSLNSPTRADTLIDSVGVVPALGLHGGPAFVETYESNSRLYSVDPDSGASTLIGPMGVGFMTDLALSATLQLLGISKTSLYSVNPSTGAATLIGPLGVSDMVGLDFAADGTLYGVQQTGGGVYRINQTTGVATLVLSTPFSYSGDIAHLGGNLFYASAAVGGGSHLIFIDLGVGLAVDRGLIAPGQEITGLDFDASNRLLAFSNSGRVYLIPNFTSSGASTPLGISTVIAAGGATTIPAPNVLHLSQILDPRRTYLRYNAAFDKDPVTGGPPLGPLVLNLSANGIAPGDYLFLERSGRFRWSSEFSTEEGRNVWAVFSLNATVRDNPPLSDPDPKRIPGAIRPDLPPDYFIETGPTITSDPEHVGSPTNICEDFMADRVLVQVPAGATHLMFGAGDIKWADNLDGPTPDYPDEPPADFRISITQIRDPQCDTDGDGTSDIDEILSGTDYANPLSHPCLTISASTLPGHTRIEWTAQPFRTYEIEESTDLSSWNPIEAPPVVTVPTPLQRDYLLSPPNRFFRLRLTGMSSD